MNRLAAAAFVAAGALAIAQTPAPITPSKTLPGHTDLVYGVAVSPDGKQFATGSFDKTIKLWTAEGTLQRTLGGEKGHTAQVTAVAYVPKQPWLASSSTDNTVKLWDAADPKAMEPIRSLAHPQLVNAIAANPAGTIMATGGQDGIIRLWDLTKKDANNPKTINAHIVEQPQKRAEPIYAILWSLDGKQLISASNDRSIKVWDAESLKLVREMKPGSDRPPPSPEVVKAAPMVLNGAASALLQKAASPGHTDQVYTMALDPTGKLLASGSADRTVKIWTLETGALVRTLTNKNLKTTIVGQPPPAHPGYVHALKFTKDGSRIVTVGTAPKMKGFLGVWTVADGALVSGTELSLGAFHSLDIAADGSALVGCGPKMRSTTESDAVLLPLPK